MRRDVLEAYPALDPERVQVIYNGIDAEQYAPDPGTEVLERWGVDAGAPSVVFVGRITRQKGVPYLVEAALQVDPAAQVVLCAGAPDTPEIAAEVRDGVERLRSSAAA
jgi:starch synthase